MDIQTRVQILGDASEFDICSECQVDSPRPQRRELDRSISHVALPGGRRTRLLKVLLSNICENDCAYCAIRSSRDVRRTAFTPDELAGCFDQMQRRLVDGLFLSSGICHHAIREMDRMIATVEIVRARYQFSGYVHLKLLPGVTADQIERAVQLGDRVSIILEAPNAERLGGLSARKGFDAELMPTLQIASQLIRARDQRTKASSVTTQFVVGAADESDREILLTSSQLYQNLGLARTYYSAFTPIPETPLAQHDATPPVRQQRLYQSDFLMRQYGFEYGELIFDGGGNLPAECDPKVAWARAHPESFPIEVNLAGRHALLRVPGIGPVVANRILQERRRGRLTELSHLRKMGANVRDVAEYILLDGQRPAYQMSLWGVD